jgi:hypothetical protein
MRRSVQQPQSLHVYSEVGRQENVAVVEHGYEMGEADRQESLPSDAASEEHNVYIEASMGR